MISDWNNPALIEIARPALLAWYQKSKPKLTPAEVEAVVDRVMACQFPDPNRFAFDAREERQKLVTTAPRAGGRR